MSLMGPHLFKLGSYNHNAAAYLKEELASAGFTPLNDKAFFNEFVMKADNPESFNSVCEKNCIDPGVEIGKWYPELEGCFLFCATEVNSRSMIDSFISKVQGAE